MGSPRLPPELTDRIIDFCHNDKRRLSNCTLTHSSWLSSSRLHLLHTITTTGAHGRRGDRATQLKSIIRRRSTMLRESSILPYIKAVKIESFDNPDQVVRLNNATHLTHTIRQFCDREHLPGPPVHATLRGSLSQNHAPSLLSFSLVSDTITHVKLSRVTFGHRNDVWPFLSSFAQLRYLELEGVGFNNSAGSSSPADGIFNGAPLSTIRMTTESMGFIIDSLVTLAGSLSHLDDFGIAYQDIRQGTLPQLADAIQRRIKCLRFTADCYPGDQRRNEWRPSAFDMGIPEFVGRFLSLNTLVLDNLRVDCPRSNVSFEWISVVLQQLSSLIQRLVFEVTVTEYSQLDAIPWAFIDRMVRPENPQFRTLTSVKVMVKRGGRPVDRQPIWKDVICSGVALRLPALNRLGLLRCDTVGC